jgi:hypothetical protein
MPHGSYWAYIERDEAELLVGRRGDAAWLRGHYRGWAGLPPPFLQVLERKLFARFGWEWLQYAKSGRILAQDETATPDEHGHAEPTWTEAQIDHTAPDGTVGAVTARIELIRYVEIIHTSGQAETYAHPQYAIIWSRDESVERWSVGAFKHSNALSLHRSPRSRKCASSQAASSGESSGGGGAAR